MGRKVFRYALVRGLHGLLPRVPPQRTHLAVLFEMLQRVYDADGFIYGAPQRHIIHQLVAYNSSFINKEESTVGYQFSGYLETPILIQITLSCQNLKGF